MRHAVGLAPHSWARRRPVFSRFWAGGLSVARRLAKDDGSSLAVLPTAGSGSSDPCGERQHHDQQQQQQQPAVHRLRWERRRLQRGRRRDPPATARHRSRAVFHSRHGAWSISAKWRSMNARGSRGRGAGECSRMPFCCLCSSVRQAIQRLGTTSDVGLGAWLVQARCGRWVPVHKWIGWWIGCAPCASLSVASSIGWARCTWTKKPSGLSRWDVRPSRWTRAERFRRVSTSAVRIYVSNRLYGSSVMC